MAHHRTISILDHYLIYHKHFLPMFIAGGSAYCTKRMNWYKGSECTRPRRIAPLITIIPTRGNMIYRTTTTPIIIGSRMSEPRKPVNMKQMHVFTFIVCFLANAIYSWKRNMITHSINWMATTFDKISSHYQRECWNCSITSCKKRKSSIKWKLKRSGERKGIIVQSQWKWKR